jgi:ornithine cyclodeaminase/alanine dehydrogenase-like protein (mu-crystallin family)
MHCARSTPRTFALNPPLFISDAEVAKTLTPALLLGSVRDALAGIAAGTVLNVGKVNTTLADENGTRTLIAMVGALPAQGIAGVKWVGTFDRNPARGLPRAPATIILTDSTTGELRAIVEATSLTARRTAAMLVVAAQCCARAPARRVAILGFGAIGKSLVPLVAAAFAPETIAVWGGDPARLETEAAQLGATHGVAIVPRASPQDAARNADIVFTASGLSEDKPFLTRAMVADRTIICAAGSYQEIADDIVQASELRVVDDWAGCSKRGNLAAMVRRGTLTRADVHMELPALIAAAARGEVPTARLPVVVMIGLGALDVAIAKELLPRSADVA